MPDPVPNLLDLGGRTAIVTGGGTGIGAATARLLVQHGAAVVIASRTADELEARAAAIRAATGGRCLAVPTDVKDETQVVHLVQRALDAFGRIDILVNNAGGTRMGPLTGLPTRAWDAAYDLNVRSAYFCTREAGRQMIAQRSGAPHGIRANCVAVGLVASERAVEAWKVAGIDPQEAATSTPLRRAGRPDEVASGILFLASDAASYITGQTLAIDGGPPMGGVDV